MGDVRKSRRNCRRRRAAAGGLSPEIIHGIAAAAVFVDNSSLESVADAYSGTAAHVLVDMHDKMERELAVSAVI